MKVLVTGGFGVLGSLVALSLKNEDYIVDVFDYKNKTNKKRISAMKKEINKTFFYGKINIEKLLKNDYDVIVHFMQISPWNFGSTYSKKYSDNENLLKQLVYQCEKLFKKPSLVYISSTRVFGPTQNLIAPVNTCGKVNPVSNYSKSILNCENYISDKDLKYCILRITDILFTKNDFPENMLVSFFDYPLQARNEMITDLDACTAIVESVKQITIEKTLNKQILCIAGGAKCGWQSTNKRILKTMFSAMGIGMLDEQCFTKNSDEFELDWYDTRSSEQLLNYQKTNISQYIEIMRDNTEKGGAVVKYLAPKIKAKMEKQSPYL